MVWLCGWRRRRRTALPSSCLQVVVCGFLGGGSSLFLGGGPLLAWLSISGFDSDLLRSADFMAIVSLPPRWGILEAAFVFVVVGCFCFLLFSFVRCFCPVLCFVYVVGVVFCCIQGLVGSNLPFLQWIV